MQQRAQEIGGTVKVIPIVDKGTEVTLWVPRPGLAPSASNN
jgi:signal transduction histidine kinase